MKNKTVQLRVSRDPKNILLWCTICKLFKSIPVCSNPSSLLYSDAAAVARLFSRANKRMQQLARRKLTDPAVVPTCPIARLGDLRGRISGFA